MERRARLGGLDAPTRAQHHVRAWPTPEQLDDGMARLTHLLKLDEAGGLIEIDE
jgi:hypothetical protein